MAFYGRVTNESKTSMTFDRVYPNKAAMDAGARDGDGVFSGRFVLVEYGNTTEEYSTNYNIDKDASPNGEIGRGYDSTVWRKVIANDGTAKYTMLAELNSVVPSFGLVTDPPTNEPAPPHFGKNSSNVYYPLHIQTPWGFKIAEAEPDKSDVVVEHYSAFNTANENIQELESYNGAIYFNEEGFNPQRTHHVDEEETPNKITITPASSGRAIYGDPKTTAYDMQELSISLPAIGNAMSDAYDIMYGKDEPGRNRRNQDMRWLDANKQINNKFEGEDEALRLVYNIPNEVALDYVPEDAESLAGSINAVHDIMGMIITTDERPAAAEAFRDQIYYEKYAIANDANRAIDKQYYTKVNGEYIPLAEDDPWEAGNTYYELAGKYYCVVPTAGYREEPVDTTWTVAQFKENLPQFDDAPITGLKQYDKKGFVLEDNTPTYVLRKTEHAAPGELYYSIPTHLDYAGKMSGHIDYIVNGKNYQHIKDAGVEVGTKEILKNGDSPTAPEMYRIAMVTVNNENVPGEQFNNVTEYFTYNELSKTFTRDRSVTAANFANKVNTGLYCKGAKSGFAINRNSTIYYVKYTTTSNTINMKKLSGIGNNGYKLHLQSLTEFINFLASGADASETLDSTSLYIQGEAYEDADGNINYKYVRYPLNKFIFGAVDSGTADFADIYKRESVTVDGQQYYNYIRATYNDFNLEGGTGNTGTEDAYQWYKLDVTTSNRWTPGEFWTITLETETEQQALINKQIAGELEDGINTEDYNIIKIRKDWNEQPTGTAVYFSIPDGQDFSPVGYGIASKLDEEKESDPDLKLYYSPNTLYEKKANGKYVIADSAYNFVEGESELYRVNELYIINVGDLKDSLILWSRWNNDLIQTNDDIQYYFKSIAQGGHGVKIGYKFDDFEWKELKGFARDLNTIHGWIIKLNRIINTDDFKTRDTSTLQGCINSINDILAKFDELPPGGLLGTNKFGQISTISFSGDSGHITVTTTFNENVDSPNYGQPEVSIAHANVLTTTAGEFGETVDKSVSFGDSFKVLNATVDAKGHLTTLRARTMTLPAPDAGATTLSTYSYTYSATDSILGVAITNSDNLTTAIEKLQWQIDHHENDVDEIQTDADVNAAVMSSFTTTGISGVVTTTDSLATAIGKLQVQINALVGAGSAANAVGTFSSSGSGNNVAALTVTDGVLTASLNNLTEVTLAGFTQGSSTAAIAAGDTLGTALSKLQANITAMTGSEYVFTSVENNYAKIFRQPNEPSGNTLKSGWIWINTGNGYVYFYTGSAWELLNSWQ